MSLDPEPHARAGEIQSVIHLCPRLGHSGWACSPREGGSAAPSRFWGAAAGAAQDLPLLGAQGLQLCVRGSSAGPFPVLRCSETVCRLVLHGCAAAEPNRPSPSAQSPSPRGAACFLVDGLCLSPRPRALCLPFRDGPSGSDPGAEAFQHIRQAWGQARAHLFSRA